MGTLKLYVHQLLLLSTGKKCCFERIVNRFGRKCQYIVVGGGSDEEKASKQVKIKNVFFIDSVILFPIYKGLLCNILSEP